MDSCGLLREKTFHPGMKKFLLQMFRFSLLLLAGGLLLELFFRVVPNHYSVKDKIIHQNYATAEVLLFGNSHSFYGFNPKYFNTLAVNLANISQSLYFYELLINKYLDSFPKVKTIVLNIDYFTLSQVDNEEQDRWRKYYYSIYMNLDVPIVSKYDYKSYSVVLATEPVILNTTLRRLVKEHTIVECDEMGWGKNPSTAPVLNNLALGKTRVKQHEYGTMDFSSNLKRLNRIITKCSKRDLKVVLVTMPVMEYYYKSVKKNKLRKIQNNCKDLSLISNVYYLNLFSDSRFTHEDFYDTDHLNANGATKCSRILDDYLKTINN